MTTPATRWWTTIATDRTTMTSQLLVIPAADLAAGPVARVQLPRRVPAGLHGSCCRSPRPAEPDCTCPIRQHIR